MCLMWADESFRLVQLGLWAVGKCVPDRNGTLLPREVQVCVGEAVLIARGHLTVYIYKLT